MLKTHTKTITAFMSVVAMLLSMLLYFPMLMDTNLLHEALRDIRFMSGEDVYESYCGVF